MLDEVRKDAEQQDRCWNSLQIRLQAITECHMDVGSVFAHLAYQNQMALFRKYSEISGSRYFPEPSVFYPCRSKNCMKRQ